MNLGASLPVNPLSGDGLSARLPGTTFTPNDNPFAQECIAPAVQLPEGVSLREYLTSKRPMRIQWKNEPERAEALIFELAKSNEPNQELRRQVFRWTGWSGSIGEHGRDLPILFHAFEGVKGFHLFGGTQVRNLDTGIVIPSIGDVPVALKKNDKDVVLIGIIPKVVEEPLFREGLGLILHVDKARGIYTSINDDQNIGLVLQPDVNNTYKWIHEVIESRRICHRLMASNWPASLVVFGGSVTKPEDMKLSTVEQELLWWAEDARLHPEWNINVILIRGSGGVADQYAGNASWLAENPRVKVVDLDVNSIRGGISRLKNVVTDWSK